MTKNDEDECAGEEMKKKRKRMSSKKEKRKKEGYGLGQILGRKEGGKH